MTVPAEAHKAELVAQAAALAAERVGSSGAVAVQLFVAEFYRHVPPADIVARGAAELCDAALSLWRLGTERGPGATRIRIGDPRADGAGGPAPRTVIEIVNDDMPFLVDSITGAVVADGRVVDLVIHPILNVLRDNAGRLRDIGPNAGGARESWMQIEISPAADPAAAAGLERALGAVLADVRVAVEDWPKMRAVVRGLLGELVGAPPPLPRREIDEGGDFLRWLDDDNFTFLGFREYRFDGRSGALPSLGTLRDPDYPLFGGLRDITALPADVQGFLRRPELLVVTKTNRRGTVHRTAHMDAIGVRRFAEDGAVIGVRVVIGLFTSLAYSRSVRAIPLIRRKVERVMARAGLAPASHDGKALLHILDTLPRDELFQSDADALFDTATGILNLQERQRIAVFVRRDPLERFASCLVYVPRDRYDTALRQRFAAILEDTFAGEVAAFYTHLDDEALARVQYIIRTTRGAVPAIDPAALEARLAEAGRSWSDRVDEAAAAQGGEALARLRRLAPLPIAYQARTQPEQAIADLDGVAAVLAGAPLAVRLQPATTDASPTLRLYRAGAPVILSDVLPILENLGLRIVAEEPFRITADDDTSVWIDAFDLEAGGVPAKLPAALCERFEAALAAVWTGEVENDGFNRLVLAAGLSARQITILRLYCKVQRQTGSNFSQAYMEATLAAHPDIAARLVRVFELRFDPDHAAAAGLGAIAEIQAIDHALDTVASLDEDRILRNFLTLVLRSLRTNYFQTLPDGGTKPYLAVKFASSEIELLPLPRPLYEIYVYSPRVEGVHLRAGRVARGGIRWSDRKEDFRTEILGLMKAQTVKNAVIVPVGSKGGFVVKRPPAARDGLGAEAVECYKILIRGLLDLTDNIVSDETGLGETGSGETGSGETGTHRIVPPPLVVRHDGDDAYLVVAADKGTATFSDIANGIALEYGFWLGDAFASGGSAGFDHKEMGITSRGAWELIKRHFRGLDRDIQTTPFTVVGVGDMSGDVFGNGMLQSREIRLLAAFNHLHIFVDPSPDAALSYAERQRLFHLERSSWGDYDRALISAGGGVFERSAKSIAPSPELKALFGITADHLTPAELIRVLLAADVDLLWFGGIGTYVKARSESHAEIGDRANDALRIDAETIRAKVVGEGANLGVSERGRIAYALRGGRIDTDAIDNSAGVDTSDHEVNIKILLNGAIAAGALPRGEREALLAGMVDDVAALVLRDNYLQGEALSVAEARGFAALDRQIRLMRALERAGRLDRAVEFLPDDETLAARAASRQGLTRPELAVLLAYAKMALYDELLESGLPDEAALRDDLAGYFPPVLRERFAPQIATHPLHREIVATVVTNELVNRAGLTFVHDMRVRTGRSAAEIAQSYKIVSAVFDLPPLWRAIEALDNKAPDAVQTSMLIEIADLVEHAAAWLLRAGRLDVAAEIARLGPPARELGRKILSLMPPEECRAAARGSADLMAAGRGAISVMLAANVAAAVFLAPVLEIVDLAERSGRKLEIAARTYYAVGARFALDEMRVAAHRLPAETHWQQLATEAMVDDLFTLQTDIAARALSVAGDAADPLAAWAATRAAALAPAEALATELRAATTPDLATLVVATRQLRHAVG